MPLANSWATRWNRRSEPARSTWTSIPGYRASNAFASFSPTGRSMAEYSTTLASLRAASTSAGVIDTGSGPAALDAVAAAQSPSATEPLIRSRRDIVFRIANIRAVALASDVKNLLIARLDLFAVLFGAFGVFLHGLDVGERRTARMFLDLRMQRTEPADFDDHRLRLGREAVVLEQFCRTRIGGGLEDAVRPDHEGRALGRINRLDRLAGFLEQEDIVFVAVGHHAALTERELFWRIGRGLNLHDVLLGELLQELPTDIARHFERRGENGSAVAGMGLDDLALPFRIEQILETAGRVFALHQFGVVGHRAQRCAKAGIGAVGVPVLGLVVLRHIFRHVRQQNALLLPGQKMR